MSFDGGGIGAMAPVSGQEFRLQAETDRKFPPEGGEMAGFRHQDPIAGGKSVHQRRFPGAGTGRGIDHHGALGLKDPLDAVEDGGAQPAEIGAAMVDGRMVYRPQDTVGDVGRTGDLKEVTSAVRRHGGSSF